ncbi:MAG: diguanylate cyclase [Candidatus Omnitrophica bacterium]|nr:diguanylate cyclase [Candidatus Omnitrophota bacterium]
MSGQLPQTKNLDIAYIDELTGVYNRRFLTKFLDEEFPKFKRLAVFMMDIDGFKKVNDAYGHLEGDALLVSFCKVLKDSVADNGVIVRYGGDEFSVILPEKTEKEAVTLAENLLSDIASRPLKGRDDAKNHIVTASVGIAICPEDAGKPTDLLDKADEALYSSKRMGRNRISTSSQVAQEITALNKAMKILTLPGFVDRKEELDALKALFDASVSDISHAAVICGERGSGKSRLLDETLAYAAKSRTVIIKLKLEEFDSIRPYGVITDSIVEYIKNTTKERREEISNCVEAGSIVELANFSSDFKGLFPVKKIGPSEVSDTEKRRNLFKGLSGILKGVAGDKTLVLGVDDLHRIDLASLGLIEYLLKDKKMKLFLCATALEGSRPRTDIQLSELRLGPLAKQDVKDIILKTFEKIQINPAFLDILYKKTAGNPLFVIEALKLLMDKKKVYFRDGEWTLAARRDADIPASLDDVEKARIEKFDKDERDIMTDAAFLGDRFNLDMLNRVSHKKTGYVLDAVNIAKKLDMVRPEEKFDAASFGFANGQIRELFRGLVTKLKAKETNKKIVTVLESYNKEGVTISPAELFTRYKMAGEEGKARDYANSMSTLTSRGFSPEEMLTYLEVMPDETGVGSVEEILEKPLGAESKLIVSDVLIAVRGAIELALLYPANNEARIEHKDDAYRQLSRILRHERSLTLSVAEGQLLVNGEELSDKRLRNTIGMSYVKLFANHRVNSITFKQGVSEQDLGFFLEAVIQKESDLVKLGGFSKFFADNNVLSIKIDEVRYEKAHKSGGGLMKYAALQDFLSGTTQTAPARPKTKEEMRETIGALYGMAEQNASDGSIDSTVDAKTMFILDSLQRMGWSADEMRSELEEVLESKGIPRDEVVKLLSNALRGGLTRVSNIGDFLKNALGGDLGKEVPLDFRSVTRDLLTRGKESTVLKLTEALLQEVSWADAKSIRLILRHVAEIMGVILSEERYGLLKKVIPRVQKVLDRDSDDQDASLVCEPFIKIFDSEETAKDPFELYVKRRKAATAMQGLGRIAISGLRFQLSEQDPDKLKSLVAVSGYMGDQAIVPYLAPLAKHKDSAVKQELVMALQRLGGLESVRVLVLLLADTNEELRNYTMDILMTMCGKTAVPELKKYVSDPQVGESVKKIIDSIREANSI